MSESSFFVGSMESGVHLELEALTSHCHYRL